MKELIREARKRVADLMAGFRHDQSYAVQHVPEIPDPLEARTIYLLGTPEPWSVALLCPCGCHETIHISLLPNDSPSWSLHINPRNEPTLKPSIWRQSACKSHFFLRNGRIVWYVKNMRHGPRER